MNPKYEISKSAEVSSRKRNILISFLTFDKDDANSALARGLFKAREGSGQKAGRARNRNDIWRPAVAMARYHELEGEKQLFFDEYYLIISKSHKENPEHPEKTHILPEVTEDIKHYSPNTVLHVETQNFNDPYNFTEVYSYLYKLSHEDRFSDSENCLYYVNCTSGTYVMRSCLFALTQEGFFPGYRIEPRMRTSTAEGHEYSAIGNYEIDDPEKISTVRHKIVTGTRYQQKRTHDLLTSNIPTNNPKFKALVERIGRTVSITVNKHRIIDPILFTGATGSGKTAIVEAITEKIWKKTLFRVNCAELRGDPNIAISRLFGHTKNAYTGCGPAKDGIFTQAKDNVLFLDEIGELPPEAQSMLLTSIERRPNKKGYWFTKLGSSTEINSEFQLICGTNRELDHDPGFRKDLLARISTWHFELPSLADRRDDIPEQKRYPLDQFEADYGVRREFSQEAAKRFEEFAATWPWTGNFREFNDMIRRMATLAPGSQIQVSDVEREIKLAQEKQSAQERSASVKSTDSATPAPAAIPPPPVARPSGMDRLKELLGKDFAQIDVKSRILAAYLIETCDSNPQLKTQKELAALTQVNTSTLSRWLNDCQLEFHRGIIARKTTS